MQYQFLLDATGKYTNIYIIKDNNSIVYEAHYLNEKNLSYELTHYIETSFKELNIWYKDINQIFLVYGPGKFSAMRISSILIKTWATIFKPQIYIINKLFYMAKTFGCVCIVHADGNKHYVSKYLLPIKKNDSILLLNNDELKKYLENNSDLVTYFDELDEVDDISNRLLRFTKTDSNFTLDYHKPPC